MLKIQQAYCISYILIYTKDSIMEVIMSEHKKGDIVELECDINMHFPKGIKMTVLYTNKDYIELGTSLKAKAYNVKKVDEFKPDYETSNRKKLKDAVIKTGFSSKDLSITMGFNDNYLSGYISKSRMSERGDISEEQLHSILASLNFAVDGLSHFNEVKNADKLKFGDAKFECSSNITEADKKEINVALDDIISDLWKGECDQRESKNNDDHVDALSYAFLNSPKHKSKYSNFIKLQKLAFAICFIMAILLISILYFVVSK